MFDTVFKVLRNFHCKSFSFSRDEKAELTVSCLNLNKISRWQFCFIDHGNYASHSTLSTRQPMVRNFLTRNISRRTETNNCDIRLELSKK